MKIVFAADIHMRETIWVRHPAIKGDSFIAFKQLCEYAFRLSLKDPTIVILGGDIFDSTFPSGQCENAFKEAIECLRGKVPVYFIEGNHDKEDVPRPLLWGCTQLTETPIEINGVSVCGINFTRNKEQLQTTLANLSPCDYLVLHSPFKHLLGFAGKWQLEYTDIPSYVGKVLVGDIHVKSVYKNIYSTGSLAVNGVSEFTTDHGFFVFDTVTNTEDYVPIKTRPFTTLYWPLERKDLATIDISGLTPVVQIIYTPADAGAVDAFIEDAQQIYFIKTIKASSDVEFDVDRPSMMSREEVLASAVERYLGDDPRALCLAIDLLLGKDSAETILASTYKEYCGETVKDTTTELQGS